MNAILKYPGAKWSLAEWIIGHFPPPAGRNPVDELRAGAAAGKDVLR